MCSDERDIVDGIPQEEFEDAVKQILFQPPIKDDDASRDPPLKEAERRWRLERRTPEGGS